MLENNFIKGKQIYLREVRSSDANANYYKWLNSPEINKYLETRFIPQSLDKITAYINNLSGQQDEVFFAICWQENKKHIGNIKLGPMNWIHRRGDIGLLIGEKDYWQKGVATEAISLVAEYAFNILNLNKITAGCHRGNIGSLKAFQKAGFIIEGERKKHSYLNGEYVDTFVLGLITKH